MIRLTVGRAASWPPFFFHSRPAIRTETMSKISLTLIQTFYQVARHGSFSGAARELNLSYQSAANHVRRLEQLLKGKLIDSEQGAKRIALTPRGRALYNLLHPELDIMLERLTKLIENQRSSLRVGMPQAIFFYLFPRVLKRFREQFPDMEFSVYERDTVLAELVKNGSLDVCISERYFGDPVVPQRLLGSYRLSLVYPREWGAAPDPKDIARWAGLFLLDAARLGRRARGRALAGDRLGPAGGGGPPGPAASQSREWGCRQDPGGYARLSGAGEESARWAGLVLLNAGRRHLEC